MCFEFSEPGETQRQLEFQQTHFGIIRLLGSCHSLVKSCLTLCNPMDCSVPGSSVLHYLEDLLKFMSIELVMLSNHLILCHPLLLLPPILPSTRAFSNEWALRIKWPKYWSFSLSTSSSNAYSRSISLGLIGLISLLFKGLWKSLLQHHNSKASVLRRQPSLWSNIHNCT